MGAKKSKPIFSKPLHVPISVSNPPLDLPMVIMLEIFSRLTIKTIFRCKTVCKLWYRLLASDPVFLNMYHTRSPNFPCILFKDRHANPSILELKADYDHCSNHERPIVLSPKFHLPPLKSKIYIIGSCNGFICLLDGEVHDENRSVYIINPLLGEYFKLKLPKLERRIVRYVAYGFCFSEAFGQYKVLRLVVTAELAELEVYTLGVDKIWRNVGQVLCPKPQCESFGNFNVNGVIHWLGKCTRIYSFAIGTEEKKPLPAPPGLEVSYWDLTLAELGNYLCLTDNSSSEHLDIWWMKEYGIAESWTKYRILKYSIQPDILKDRFIPIMIWKDGEILMRRDGGPQLVSYNPKENKFRKVKVYGGFAATRYNPSFYSLKTIIGESFQVSNAYSGKVFKSLMLIR
ncbi:F-box protein like [Capsicum galapagoense]